MTDTESWASKHQFVEQLQTLCANQATGTLFCVTRQGTSATVSIQQGTIVGIGFRRSGGTEALKQLQAMDACKLSYKPHMPFRTDFDLPNTAQIIQALGGDPTVLQTTSKPAANFAATMGIAQTRLLIEQQACQLFGPVAMVVVAECFSDLTELGSAEELRVLLTAIADMANEGDQADALIKQVFDKANFDPRQGRSQ